SLTRHSEAHSGGGEEGAVKVALHMAGKGVHFVGEKMIRAGNHAVVNLNAALGGKLVGQFLHAGLGHDFIGLAGNDHAGGGAGGEEGEVEHVGRRSNGNEAINFRAAHEELHANP